MSMRPKNYQDGSGCWAMFGDMGFGDVKTYVQSGNVVFETDEASCGTSRKNQKAHSQRILVLKVQIVGPRNRQRRWPIS